MVHIKRQIGIKLSEETIRAIDEARAMLPVAPTRTAFIEEAIDRLIKELRQPARPDNVIKISK